MINVKPIISNQTDKTIEIGFAMTFTLGDAQKYIADVRRVHTQECLQALFVTAEKLETELKKLGLLQKCEMGIRQAQNKQDGRDGH